MLRGTSVRNWVAVVFAFACIGLSTSCDMLEPSGHVRYEVTGTAARVNVGYENANGGTSENTNVSLPWSHEWSGAKSGDFLWVWAEIASPGGGSITVTIRKNGGVLKSETVSGPGASVDVAGTY
jgi:hypothetical protein